MASKKQITFLPCVYRTPSFKNKILIFTIQKPIRSYIVLNANSFVTKNQIESCKKIINRMLKKKRKSYSVHVQYNIVKTKKSIGSRMGKGKGKMIDKIGFFKKNNIFFEFTNLPLNTLKQLVSKLKYKIPVSISWKCSSLENHIYI